MASPFLLLVVEALPPPGAEIDAELVPGSTTEPPGLQLLSSNRLGPPSPAPGTVDCRTTLTRDKWGGIPGIQPLDYAASQTVRDAMWDFACRFQASADPEFGCTLNVLGNRAFRNPGGGTGGTVQFCHRVDSKSVFPRGLDTILRVRVRASDPDGPFDGALGSASEIVVRVPP